ncbi:MAG TPA: alkaline phosphatase family protein [Pyrinomonadaceae bacterium]|nr:alkaline phosphatase family protein [Pyrinomonadaceae bacterium]
MSVLLFFIDGLGIGSRGPLNPLDGLDGAEPLALFKDEPLTTIHDGIVVPTDACLGVDGRPQSASGQTTILTGVNVPATLGYHKQGFPNAAMLEIIRERSIFLQLTRAGIKPITFANTYTDKFFEERPRWVSATTATMEAAAIPFRKVIDNKAGKAVFHDFTNQALLDRGEDVELRTPDEAAAVLARVVSENQFTLYEYFMTDKAGHAQDMQAAKTVLRNLASLIRGVLDKIDLRQTSVILTSDHGNIEDLSSRNHTLNAVPTIIWGANRNRIASHIKTLADITPAIVDVLTRRETDTDGNAGRALSGQPTI